MENQGRYVGQKFLAAESDQWGVGATRPPNHSRTLRMEDPLISPAPVPYYFCEFLA